MRSALKDGVCVSCGRESGRHYWHCPYCGEEVWHPLWRRGACVALLSLPPLLALLLVAVTQPDLRNIAQSLWTAPPAMGYLFAAGIGLLLLPPSDNGLVVNSRAEQVRWVALAAGGGVLCGCYAALAALCLCFGRTPGAVAGVLGCAVFACVAAAPVFFRIPWRTAVASAMIAAAIALGQGG